MDTPIGQALREARLQRGIDLYEVQRQTKIRVQLLRAMEEERWDALPGANEATESLSAYASFLGLDAEELIERYRAGGESDGHAEPVSAGVIRPREREPRRSLRPRGALLAGLTAAAVVVIGLIVLGSVGGSGGGTEHGKQEGTRAPSASASRTTTTATASGVSIELRSTAPVWVCLVDQRNRALVNGETLTTDEVRGPFDAHAFNATFGNGSVELTVNGQPVKVPASASPLGYRITPTGTRPLAPSLQPTCT